MIEEEAFNGCESLNRVIIPSTVHDIEDGAFWGCASLKEVQLYEGLHVIIFAGTVGDCMSLMHMNIPSTVYSVDSLAFGNCSLLRNVAISPSSTLGDEDFCDHSKPFRMWIAHSICSRAGLMLCPSISSVLITLIN